MSFLLSAIPVNAAPNTSFIVYGQIKQGDTGLNGYTVTVLHEDNCESLTIETFEDSFGKDGHYSVNLGNLPTQWNRGDNITVSFDKAGTTYSKSFTIPDSGTMYEQNVSAPKTGGGGGGGELGSITGGGTLFIPMFIIIIIILGAALWVYGTSNPPEKRKK